MVKNGETVNIDAAVDARLRRILETVPGLAVKQVERPAAAADDRQSEPPDAVFTLAGVRLPVAITLRTNVNAAGAWAFVHSTAAVRGARPLLLAERTTAEARDILLRQGAAYIDGAGFAHAELPGLFIHVEARRIDRGRRPATARGAVRLAGKAGVLVQALLLEPERRWGVTALSQAAHTSPGLAHRVLQRLEAESLVESLGAGPGKRRRLVDPTALLDLWVEEARDVDVRRKPAFRPARTPRELVWHVANALDTAGVPHAVTGAAAAGLLASEATVAPVTEIWVTEHVAVDEILDTANTESADSEHNLVLLQSRDDLPLAFRAKCVAGLWTVNPLRLYVDLRTGGSATRDQAEQARHDFIRF